MSEEVWHPASDPPDADRVVMLRIDCGGLRPSFLIGRYTVFGRYERRMSSRDHWGWWQQWYVSPDWWRELTEGEGRGDE